MSTPTSGGDVPIRSVDRFLAFTALGLAAAAIVCFFAVIIARPAGVTDFSEGIWPLIVLLPGNRASSRLRHDRGSADHELRAEGSGEPRGLMVSDERALATWLAARDDVGLAKTLADRGVPPTVGWHDFFDAAEGLLDAASLDRALSRLPRRDLAALARGDAEPSADVSDLALLGPDGRPFAVVADRVQALTAGRPDALIRDVPADTPRRSDERSAAAAAERAFTTAGALADVLLACLHTPLVAHRHGHDQRRRSQAPHRGRRRLVARGARRPHGIRRRRRPRAARWSASGS